MKKWFLWIICIFLLIVYIALNFYKETKKETKTSTGLVFENLSDDETLAFVDRHKIKHIETYKKLHSIIQNPNTVIPFCGNFGGWVTSIKTSYFKGATMTFSFKDLTAIFSSNDGHEIIVGHIKVHLLDLGNPAKYIGSLNGKGELSEGVGEIKTDIKIAENNIFFEDASDPLGFYQLFISKSGNCIIGNYYIQEKRGTFERVGIIKLRREAEE
jgi:hypothetical protein